MDKDILEGFVSESFELIDKCSLCIQEFKLSKELKKFEVIGLLIDRMMGAAATLEFEGLAELLKLGKMICYKVAQESLIDKSDEDISVIIELLQYIKDFLNLIIEDKVDNDNTNKGILKQKLREIKSSLGDFGECLIIK